jgi:hypothetical protein
MTHPPYLREKARELRVKNKMSLDEIGECLALGKTTVWYWIADLPDPVIKHRAREGGGWGPAAWKAAAEANRKRFKAARDAAYRQGLDEFAELDAELGFRDFVCLYIAEGYKRNLNVVSVANSDPKVIALCNRWIKRFAANKVSYSFQHHADQDPDLLVAFWADHLGADPSDFSFQRKSNSGQLRGRKWRCRYGVLTVTANDTQFRSRLQAWVDCVMESWLHSAHGA